MRLAYADAGGIRTRYYDAGAGEALFLVHGVGSSADAFIQNIRALGQRLRVVAPDLVGHGFSAGGVADSPAPHVQMAQQVLALADRLGIARFSVAGTSYGALVAAQTALEAPGRVARLVLVGSGSTFHAPEAAARSLQAARANATRAMEEATFDTCRARYANMVHDPACIPDALVLSALHTYALPDRAAEYAKVIAGALAFTTTGFSPLEELKALGKPVLIIVGREDPRADWRTHERAAATLPDARLAIYERCGHMPYLEHPQRFNADVLQFIFS